MMAFDARGIVFYLLERGLLTAASVVDGDLRVLDSSSRNHNYKIIRPAQPGYFVKQVRQYESHEGNFLQREAQTYWLAQNVAAFAPLRPLMPPFYLVDAKRQLLVLALLEGENLLVHHQRLGHFPPTIAALVGQAIGAYHGIALPPGQELPTFPRKIPWILSAHQLNGGGGGGNAQVLTIIQQHREFHPLLEALSQQWQFDVLIHGDIKWENCILTAADGAPRIHLIDWETADSGDAGWDVGAILQAYLTFWIMSLPIAQGQSAADYLTQSRYPIEAMQPAIAAFWRAYCAERQLSQQEAGPLLLRSVQYGAARMLQTAFEYMYFQPQITHNAVAQLQVAMNILTMPSVAVSDLLGLEP